MILDMSYKKRRNIIIEKVYDKEVCAEIKRKGLEIIHLFALIH